MINLIAENLPIIGIIAGCILAPFALFAWAAIIVSVLNEAANNIHNNRHEMAELDIKNRSKS